MAVTPQRIELHIEELVLHGFSHVDGYAVAEAIERELGTRPAGRGVTIIEHGSSDRVDAGSVELPQGVTPGGVGAALGERIHGSLLR
jgi:hypothetical protein